MRQFVLPEAWDGGPRCTITGGRAHYLLRVLRLAPGDRFVGLAADGSRRALEVLEAEPGRLVLAVAAHEGAESALPLPDTRGSRGARRAGRHQEQTAAAPAAAPDAPQESLPRIVLAQAVAKGPAMDLVLRQAAETGVARVIPLQARRSVARAEEDRKVARWERIIREGLQQSGSPVPTTVEEPCLPAELPARLGPPRGHRLCFVLHETPLAEANLHGYLSASPDEVVLAVGPEGGFSPEELADFLAAGFRPIRLPGAVLRTETAALFAVAAIETILTERSAWIPPR